MYKSYPPANNNVAIETTTQKKTSTTEHIEFEPKKKSVCDSFVPWTRKKNNKQNGVLNTESAWRDEQEENRAEFFFTQAHEYVLS